MKKESIFYNSKFLILLSLLIAFLSWLFVVQADQEKQTKTLKNISINMEETEDSIGKLGLRTLTVDQQQRVDVQVEGVIYEVGGLSGEDIEVKPDISKITEAGTYDVELRATVKDKNKQITIKSITPRTIKLKFDSLETRTFDIEERISDYSAPEGYQIRASTLNPAQVTVTGPEEEISKIYTVAAQQSLENAELTSTYTGTIPLTFLDKDRNELDLKYVSPDVTEIQVTIPITKIKTIPLKLNFINVPSGFNVNSLKFEMSNDEIEVDGPEDLLNKYDQIELGYINIRDLDLDSVYSFEVKLNTGLYNTRNIKNVQVKFDSEGMTRKKFNVQGVQLTNVPLNYKVTAITEEILDVEILGPQEVVDTLTAGDIIAEINLNESSSIESGRLELPVKISVPGKNNVWAFGSYQAIVSIEDISQNSAEESEEDSENPEETASDEENAA